jgi:hypothetical protein
MLRVALKDVQIGGITALAIGVVGQLVDGTGEQRQPGMTGL